MKRVETTTTIPARTVNLIEYVANDGKIFSKEADCLKYEEDLRVKQEIESHPVFKSKRRLFLYPDNQSSTLVYLRSVEDHDFLIDQTTKLKRCRFYKDRDEFEECCGPGFYFLVVYDGGDSCDYYSLLNVKKYIEELETEFTEWKIKVEDLEYSVVEENPDETYTI